MSKRLHIVVVIRVLYERSGGAERIYCELANLFVAAGHRVTCLHFDHVKGQPFYQLDDRVERINLFAKSGAGARLLKRVSVVLPKDLRNRIEWTLRNTLFIQQLRDFFHFVKPDLAVSLLPPANTPTLLAASTTSVRVIACNHNVPSQDYDNPSRWSKNPYDRRLRLETLDKAAAIHVLFPVFANWFPDHLQDRIVAIPNYVSPNLAGANQASAREKIILGVGRLSEVKNYVQLVEAWRQIADDFPAWKLRIVGNGPQRERLEQLVHDLDLADQVELPGQVTDVSPEYNKASIFCHPSIFEGFGLSVAEALYHNLPVITYDDCSGVNEYVKNGFNGLAIARETTPDNLARAMRHLMSDDELRRAMSANCRESVKEFDYETYQKRWLDLVEQIGPPH